MSILFGELGLSFCAYLRRGASCGYVYGSDVPLSVPHEHPGLPLYKVFCIPYCCYSWGWR
jgi:hypothetical protein